jgi:hypothetical protein
MGDRSQQGSKLRGVFFVVSALYVLTMASLFLAANGMR